MRRCREGIRGKVKAKKVRKMGDGKPALPLVTHTHTSEWFSHARLRSPTTEKQRKGSEDEIDDDDEEDGHTKLCHRPAIS
jgi:hypothetical protein